MNRKDMDDFCAHYGTDNGKDDDKWREKNTASAITSQVMQGTRYTSRTAKSVVRIVLPATRMTKTHTNA